MSEVKGKRESVRKPPASKTQWTKQKPRVGESVKAEPETTVTKNLLREFNAAEINRSSNKKQTPPLIQQQSVDLSSNHSEHSVISNLRDSSISESSIISPNEPHTYASADFQLPRSYILAMRGLQEGIDVREREIKKVKKLLKEQLAANEDYKSFNEELTAEKEELIAKLTDLTHQNKFLKEMIADLKSQGEGQLKAKIELENRLKNSQQDCNRQRQQTQRIMRQQQSLRRDKASMKEQLQQITRYMNERKAEYDETMRKKTQQYAITFSQISSLRNQLSKSRQQHEKDITQINALKADIRSLLQANAIEQQRFKEQLLLKEKQHLDKLEYEVNANRQILKEVSFNQNLIQSIPKPSYQQQVPQTALKKQTQRNDSDLKSREQHISSADYRPSIDKRTPAKMQRSTSRLRQTNDAQHPERRELISQMRELMRHQKELVSLNYQIQMLQKGMACDSSGPRRQQLQKTYSKLRKNIERKQCQIRELRYFLDNPSRGKMI